MNSTTTTVVVTKKRQHYYLFFSKIWKQFYKKYYINFVKKYQLQIDLVDDTISRLLFWIPHQTYDGDGEKGGDDRNVDDEDDRNRDSYNSNNNGTTTTTTTTTTIATAAWREVCYGVLSIHRLMMHLALEENAGTEIRKDDNNNGSNDYGTSIQTRCPSTISAKGIRICLTVVHSIMPSMLEIVRAAKQQDSNITVMATTKIRLILEQIKFLLRMYLLVPYWKQQQNHLTDTNNNVNDTTTTVTATTTTDDCGILMDGGMYRIDQQFKKGITWEESKSIQRRRNYVGKRTGWTQPSLDTRSMIKNNKDNNNNIRTILADFLYAFRPLVWAWFESRAQQHQNNGKSRNENSQQQRDRSSSSSSSSQSSTSSTVFSFLFSNNWSNGTKKLLRGWILCLGMDLLSIRLLEHNNNSNNNIHINEIRHNNNNDKNHRNIRTEDEIRRRKFRLFLYALRSPVWSMATSPILDLLSKRILQKIPILGNFIEIYIWDFILYYQHPFVSEEG